MRFSRTKYIGTIATAILGSTFATTAQADTAICTGLVTTIANHANGYHGLMVTIGNSSLIRVCNFSASQFSVSPEDCKHMASIAAVAFASGTPVTFYIDNAPSTACSGVPAFHTSNTRYFAVSTL